MKRVSLMTKVPGFCVLGALGITFALSPLGAFAKCGGGGGGGGATPAVPVASIKSVEAFSSCSQRPISPTQASKLANEGWANATSTTTNGAKATVGSATTAPAPTAPLTPAQLKSISFLAGNASCSFSSVDPGAKVNLNNGDMFLAVLSGGKGASNQPVFGMLVGGKVVLFTADQTGQHFTNVVQNPKVQIDNATFNRPSSTTPAN